MVFQPRFSLMEGAVLMSRQKRSRAYCAAVSDCRSLLAFVERINGWCATWTGVVPDATQNGEEVREGRVRGSRKEFARRALLEYRAHYIHAGVHSSSALEDLSGAFEMRARVENPPKYFESAMQGIAQWASMLSSTLVSIWGRSRL